MAVAIASVWSTAGASGIWSRPQSVQFEMLSLADGLADSTIFSISQDARGRIWLGSAAGGANVFDGYQVRSFLHDPADPESLSHSAAGEVLATSEGTVIVGTWGGGLNRLLDVDGRFERVTAAQAPTHIQVLFEDSAGRVWIGSADSGLYRLDQPRGAVQPQARANGMPFMRVWSVAEGPDGDIWVATNDGLESVTGRTFSPDQPWLDYPRALLLVDDALWVADGETIYRLEDAGLRRLAGDLPLINTLARSPRGNVLLGTLAGVRAVDVDGNAVPPLGQPEPVLFPERNIRRFHFDRSGVGWIATREAGVIRAQPTVPGFDGYRLESRLATADSVYELAPDDLLLGSRRGIWRLRRTADGNSFTRVPDSESYPINRFSEAGDRVLVAARGSVLEFDPRSGELSTVPRFASLDGEDATVIHGYVDGAVDIGTWASGLFRFASDGSVRQYAPGGDVELPDVSISDIEPDGAGGIWLGLWNIGIAHVAPTGEVRVVTKETLGLDGNIHDLLFLDGELWVASSFGLAQYDEVRNSGERLLLIPDFPNTPVQRLAAGPGRIWAATNRGVIAIDREGRSVTRFGRSDGLAVEEFYARSGHVGDNGRVYFGGLGGFVSFLPGRVSLEQAAPDAAIIAAWVDGEPTTVGRTVTLPPSAGSLRLRFMAADYRNATANRFRWRLTGADDAWSAVSGDPETLFTGLDPGEYTFELEAANANGLWNRRAATIGVEVLPAWWQTLWGQSAVAIGLLSFAWAWNFWNTQRIRARNRELQHEVDRQTRALQEANRSLARAASTDYLTGLLNRRGFLAQVENADPNGQVYFAIIDVDDFKSFNDRFGHDIGDLVLQHVARVLQQATDSNALVARWGGEEFILRLLADDGAAAAAAAERARHAVETRQPEVGTKIPPITITLGLAHLRTGESCIRSINRADGRLLQGKQSGKNCLVVTG
ncbi:MAG: diguanylate cyclase [Pseudomonadota bacterium]